MGSGWGLHCHPMFSGPSWFLFSLSCLGATPHGVRGYSWRYLRTDLQPHSCKTETLLGRSSCLWMEEVAGLLACPSRAHLCLPHGGAEAHMGPRGSSGSTCDPAFSGDPETDGSWHVRGILSFGLDWLRPPSHAGQSFSPLELLPRHQGTRGTAQSPREPQGPMQVAYEGGSAGTSDANGDSMGRGRCPALRPSAQGNRPHPGGGTRTLDLGSGFSLHQRQVRREWARQGEEGEVPERGALPGRERW